MAIRPPRQDAAEPEAVTFGIAAVDKLVSEADVSFPATPEEVTAALGDPSVPYDAAGNEVPLSEAMAELSSERFDSEAELLDRLHPVFERYRSRATVSLFSRLKLILPF